MTDSYQFMLVILMDCEFVTRILYKHSYWHFYTILRVFYCFFCSLYVMCVLSLLNKDNDDDDDDVRMLCLLVHL